MLRWLVPVETFQIGQDVPITVYIMIPEDENLLAVQPMKDRSRVTFTHEAEIAEMVDDVLRTNDVVPRIDHKLVHLVESRKRTVAETDNGFMPKMRVTDIEFLDVTHSGSFRIRR